MFFNQFYHFLYIIMLNNVIFLQYISSFSYCFLPVFNLIYKLDIVPIKHFL